MIDFKHSKAAWAGVALATGIAILFNALLWRGVCEAVRSQSFATVQGVVTRSDIEPGHKGAVDYEVEYRYAVGGVPYTGTEYHVQPQFVQNRYWRAARDANPVGKAVTVYYDPDDPATAYLAPGLRSDILFVAWLSTGLTVLAVGLWLNALEYLLGRRAFDPALRRCVRETPAGWAARPDPATRFVVVFFVVLLGTFFAGCFVALIYAVVFQSPPPWAVPLAMYVAAPVIAALGGRSWSREGLILVNEREGTVEFTHGSGRVAVPRERLAPDVETQERKDSDGKPFEVFHISLRWCDEFGRVQSAKLAEYADRRDADALVAWLRDRLGLPPGPAADLVARS